MPIPFGPASWQQDYMQMQNQEIQRQNALLQQNALRQQAYDVQQTKNALADYWNQYGDYRRQQSEARSAYEAEPSATERLGLDKPGEIAAARGQGVEPTPTIPEFRAPRNYYEATALQQVQQSIQQQSAATYNMYSPLLQQLYNGDITNPDVQQGLAAAFSKDPYLAPMGTILKNAEFTKPRTFEIELNTQNPRSMSALKQWVGPENAWQLEGITDGRVQISGRKGNADVKKITPEKSEKQFTEPYPLQIGGKPVLVQRDVKTGEIKRLAEDKSITVVAKSGEAAGALQAVPKYAERQINVGAYDKKVPAKMYQQNLEAVHDALVNRYDGNMDKVAEAERTMERNSSMGAIEKRQASYAITARNSIDNVFLPKLEAFVRSRNFQADKKKLADMIRQPSLIDKSIAWMENWATEQKLSKEGREYAVAAFDVIRQVNQSISSRGAAQKSLDWEHQFFSPASSAEQLRGVAQTEREIVDSAAKTLGYRALPKTDKEERADKEKYKVGGTYKEAGMPTLKIIGRYVDDNTGEVTHLFLQGGFVKDLKTGAWPNVKPR